MRIAASSDVPAFIFQARGETSSSLWFGKGGWVFVSWVMVLYLLKTHHSAFVKVKHHQSWFNLSSKCYQNLFAVKKWPTLFWESLVHFSFWYTGKVSSWLLANEYWTEVGCPGLAGASFVDQEFFRVELRLHIKDVQSLPSRKPAFIPAVWAGIATLCNSPGKSINAAGIETHSL